MNTVSMYNSFHTALSRGSGRIEDACGESPAASLLWLRSLGEVQIIRSLFVHHSCIIRSDSCIIAILEPLGVRPCMCANWSDRRHTQASLSDLVLSAAFRRRRLIVASRGLILTTWKVILTTWSVILATRGVILATWGVILATWGVILATWRVIFGVLEASWGLLGCWGRFKGP